MPRIVETIVYRLDELSEEAKDRARAWYREHGVEHDWYDAVFDDFERICALLGVELATVPIPIFRGGVRQKRCIWFTGFGSQGDGACFEGRCRHARGAARTVRAYAPRDAELHRIADALQDVQRRNAYQLLADVTHRGRYCHEYSMTIAVERDSPTGQDMTPGAEEAVTEALRDLARWLFHQLQVEHDDLTSDEAVDEAIIANEYTFTADGRRFG